MHCQAGEVGHRLVMGGEQADQQGSTTMMEVDGPQHIVGYGRHVTEQRKQLGLWMAKSRKPSSGSAFTAIPGAPGSRIL